MKSLRQVWVNLIIKHANLFHVLPPRSNVALVFVGVIRVWSEAEVKDLCKVQVVYLEVGAHSLIRMDIHESNSSSSVADDVVVVWVEGDLLHKPLINYPLFINLKTCQLALALLDGVQAFKRYVFDNPAIWEKQRHIVAVSADFHHTIFKAVKESLPSPC